MSDREGSLRESSALKRETLELFAPLPRHYDRVAAVLSFGQDPRWRRAMVAALEARPGERVLDVATGTGLVTQELVGRYGCEVVGLDQSPEMLARAKARVDGDHGLARLVSLREGEAEHLPFANAEFDHLTFTYLLRYVEDPGATMAELARVVKPGGRIASLEFGVPPQIAWRRLWEIYTHVGLPSLGRLVSREWAHTGRFLVREHPQFLRALPDSATGQAVGTGGHRGRASSLDEPRRRRGHVGLAAPPRPCAKTVASVDHPPRDGPWWERQNSLSALPSTRCGGGVGVLF